MKIEKIKEIILKIKRTYNTNIFPEPEKGSCSEIYTAAGARLACDLIFIEIEKELKTIQED